MKVSLGYGGGITAPQKTAALAAYDILRDGGTAIEAMVAAAATIAVTYPHMNGIGGDAFWLVKKHNQNPIAISGCGYSAGKASVSWYGDRGYTEGIPTRGGASALTVPGAVASWIKALSLVEKPMPVKNILENAVSYARDGFAVTENQCLCTTSKYNDLYKVDGFAETFLVDGQPPKSGFKLTQDALKNTLEVLGQDGLDSFYRGDLAKTNAKFLSENESPLRLDDFLKFRAEFVEPIKASTSKGDLYNLPAPTQGISSLMILALFDKMGISKGDSFEHIHSLIEITKQVFLKRNLELGDPNYMSSSERDWLSHDILSGLLSKLNPNKALRWPYVPNKGDTVWMGAVDAEGTVVSFIQSVFWEFGSGLTCPETGVFFQNRGAGFSLQPGPNQLFPRKQPFHTLNPALALLKDGRRMVYGTMGGDGQPQTQSAIFSRYAYFDYDLQHSISLPRWLLGKTWGDTGTTLKLESRFDPALIKKLGLAGHNIELIDDYSDLAGHAGALVLSDSGLIEGASDPRSDGSALVF